MHLVTWVKTLYPQYKNLIPDEGDPRPKAEFEASELEPRYVGGPEDADIEFDGRWWL